MQLRRTLVRSLLALLVISAPLVAWSQPTATRPVMLSGNAAASIAASGRGSLRFTENRGQVASTLGDPRPDILFTAEGKGLKLFFRTTGLSYVFVKVDGLRPPTPESMTARRNAPIDSGVTVTTYRMDMDLIGANPDPVITKEEEREGYTNYYLAHCPNGITGVRSYGRLIYHEIYPKIDLVFYSTEGGLKYDFVVHPGGRVSDIRMRYTGADSLRALDDGKIVVTNQLGMVTEGTPLLYQRNLEKVKYDGSRTNVPGRYMLQDDSEIRFDVGSYDHSQSLVIDPSLIWSTYFGGSYAEYAWGWLGGWAGWGSACRQDRDGNILAGTSSGSVDFPTRPGVAQVAHSGSLGAYDWALVKFTPQGGFIWGTYYGGIGHDYFSAVAAFPSGDIVMVGTAGNGNFPTSPSAFCNTPAQWGTTDGAIVKLDANGARVWATFSQGGNCADVAVDPNGTIMVVGQGTSFMNGTPGTFSPLAPPNGVSIPFISRFTSGGARVWNTFIAGTPIMGMFDEATAVAIDSNLNIVVAGVTSAGDFPVSANPFQANRRGSQDAFLAKLDTTGNRVWATYFGGTDLEYASDVAIDGKNNIVFAGATLSVDMPLSGNSFQTINLGNYDTYITRFNSSGGLLWSTYYGGLDWENSAGICIDPSNNYWLVGNTTSANFPVTADAYQVGLQDLAPNHYSDGFIVKLDSSGGQRWASYLGGPNWDYPSGVCADHIGVTVTGSTYLTGFPVTSGAFQSNSAGSYDGFLSRFCDPSAPMTITRPTRFCQGDSTVLSVPAGFDTYRWSTGATTRSITVTQSGSYSVTVGVATCTVSSGTVNVLVYPVTRRIVGAVPTSNLCQGDSAVLGIGGGMRSYLWSTGATSPTITVRAAGRYFVKFVDTNGCDNYSDTITVNLNARPAPSITPMGPLSFCQWEEVMLDGGAGHHGYRWSTGDSLQHLKVTKSGTYTLRVMNEFGCWGDAMPITVKVYPQPFVKISPILPTVFCDGDSTILSASPGFASYRWSHGARTQNVTLKKAGRYTLIATDTNGCRDTVDVDVKVTARPVPRISATGPIRFCQGDSVTLYSTGGFTRYQWATGAETPSIVVKRSGIYYLIATSEQGCPGVSDTITVQVLDRPTAAITGPSTVCRNSLATYSVPKRQGLTYQWQVSGGDGAIASGEGTNQIAVQWGPSGSGVISLSVRNDSTGCRADTTFAVQISTSLTPVITANGSLTICQGESVTLDAGSYSSYAWSTGATTRTITVSQPGDYTVAVVDAKGCSGASAAVTVQVNQPTAPVIDASNNGRLCPGGAITLDAGAGYTSYLWSNGALGQQISISREGSYSVTAIDANGCSATSKPYEVTLAPTPTPAINGPSVVCRNSTIGYSTPAIDGAVYTWSVTGGTLVDGEGSDGISVRWGDAGEGMIELAITTAEGCTGTAEALKVSIGDKLEPVVTPSGTVALCRGESVTLDAGAGYTSYLWSNGATTRTITVSDPETVTVTVSDANGCSGTSSPVSVEAKEPPAPVITPAGVIDLCEGDSVVLGTEVPYASYLWSNGAVTRSIKVRRSGSYSVRVRSRDGCQGDALPVMVNVHVRPAKPVIVGRGDTLEVANAATNGARYEWSLDGAPIGASGSATTLARDTGLYSVRVIDPFGCSAQSDPYRLVGSPVIGEHGVWLDTVSATVGERVRLVMRVDPPIAESEGVMGYRAVLHVDPRALFFHRAISSGGGAVAGNSAQMRYRADGTVTVDHIISGAPIVGAALFELDLEGLITGSPLNLVTIDSVTLVGNAHASILGDGLVVLSGCEMGADFGKLVRIESIRPNPASSDVVVGYHGPAGSELRLRLTDGVGREQSIVELPRGTGDRQEVHIRVDGLPSGVYMVELRNGGERSVLPIIIKK